MFTHTPGRAKSTFLITAWILAAIIALIGSGLTGTAHAQAGSNIIPSITLDSQQPGQLVVNWQAPASPPTDYRIRWANADLGFPSYSAANEAERGNEYPAGDATTITINDLTPGDSYKVQVRSRYYNANRTVHQSSGPWTNLATQRVNDHPPAAPTGLTASAVAHDSLTIAWEDPQDDSITGYRILRGNDAGSLSTLANTQSDSTSYTDSTVEPETTYRYAVAALSQDGNSIQSGALSATTPAEPPSEEQDDPGETPKEKDPPQRVGARQVMTTNVWTATLTPATNLATSWKGCLDNCNDAAILSDDTFTYDSFNYTIVRLDIQNHANPPLVLGLFPLMSERDAENLTLVVGSTRFAFADATLALDGNNRTITWSDSGLAWTVGTDVAVKITVNNNAPRVANAIPDRAATASTAFRYRFPSNTFADADDNKLTYAATKADGAGLPTWLMFDARTRTFSGTPTTAETVSVKVTASDGITSASDEFDIVVKAAAAAITTAPDNWSLGPTGLNAGDRFRLIFLSSAKITPDSTSIATYNTLILGLAATGHTDIRAHSAGFRAVGCTGSVDARANTGTTGRGVPIYWLNGNKVADHYADFYDGSWDDEANDRNESGTDAHDTSQTSNYPITGCYHNGTRARSHGYRESRALGAASVRVGQPNSSTASNGPLQSSSNATHANKRPMYGLSGVFQVAGNVAPTVAIPIPNRTAVTNAPFTYTFPTNTFDDRNTDDTLTYAATKADSAALPTWLMFDANARTFSGTPTAVETVSVKLTARDGTASISDIFDIEVTDPILNTRTLVSNTGQNRDQESVVSTNDHAQAFTTGAVSPTVTSVTISSEDTEGDAIALKICGTTGSSIPTATCTDLTAPGTFPAGPLIFTAPNMVLTADTTYSVVFTAEAGDSVTLDATDSDAEDTSSQPGWSIRNRSQIKSTNWADRSEDRAIIIAVTGTIPNIAATGAPTIAGTAHVAQMLTASTSAIRDQNGLPAELDYQWKRYAADGNTFESDIGANTRTYTLTTAEEGKKIKVQVTFNDQDNNSEGPLLSAPHPRTGTVSAAFAPLESTQREDRRYTFNKSDFTNLPDGRVTLTSVKITELPNNGWLARGVTGTSENGNRQLQSQRIHSGHLPLTLSTDAQRLSLTFFPEDNENGTPYASFKFKVNRSSTVHTMLINITPVNDPAYGRVFITGPSQVGYDLTASTSSMGDRDGIPHDQLNYQWQRYAANGTTFEADIGTNSSTYRVTDHDVGKKIRLEVRFTDNEGTDEGPITSDAFPYISDQKIGEATFQSIMGIGGDTAHVVSDDHGQTFTTGTHPNGYTLSRVVLQSEDPEGDDLAVKICGVNTNGDPTAVCTDLTVPGSFTRGLLSFTAPSNTTLTGGRTNYMVVISSPGSQSVRLGATRSDGFDSSALGSGWSIATKTRMKTTDGWENVNGTRIRIAVLGTINP